MRYCFFNGEILPAKEARIGINDLGLLRSYAVFDYLRTYNGRPFRLNDHLHRFRNSALELMLPFEYSEQDITDIIERLLEKSEMDDAAIRMILTGGYSSDSMSVGQPNFVVSVEELQEYPAEIYRQGVKLITYEYLRDVPQAKSTSYLNAIKLDPVRKQHGAFDILYTWKGNVLEITRNNFFIFKGDTLITPKDDVLLGITRMVVLELATHNFEIEERAVQEEEIREADEAFICGTTKKIIPVVRINDLPVGDGSVGQNTKTLMGIFQEYIGAT